MKTTLDIDAELYREAKAHASLTGRKMKDLVTEGLRLALQRDLSSPRNGSSNIRELESCFAEADRAVKAAPKGPSARHQLAKGRSRLDPS